MPPFVKALTHGSLWGKTLLESRDMSYAVINAIMKMKIAVVCHSQDNEEPVSWRGGRFIVAQSRSEAGEPVSPPSERSIC